MARHLASEIGAEAALRVVALPHTEGCGVSDERLAARTLLGHLASPLVRYAGYPPTPACTWHAHVHMHMCTLLGHIASPPAGHALLPDLLPEHTYTWLRAMAILLHLPTLHLLCTATLRVL